MSIKLSKHKYKLGDELYYTKLLSPYYEEIWIEKGIIEKIGYRFSEGDESFELLYLFSRGEVVTENEIAESKQELLEIIKKSGEEISKKKR